eukprot:11669667-Alexandrium_andersonii.AAC.1
MLVGRTRSAQRLAVWPWGLRCCALGASASAQVWSCAAVPRKRSSPFWASLAFADACSWRRVCVLAFG